MSEHERVVIIEDEPSLRKLMGRNLKVLGHEVVGEAATISEALDLIPQFKEINVTAVIIDGSLGADSRGADGALVNGEIKKMHPDMLTIGWSQDLIEGVDVQFGKHDRDGIYEALKNH